MSLKMQTDYKTFCCIESLSGLLHRLQNGRGGRGVVRDVRAVHIHVDLHTDIIIKNSGNMLQDNLASPRPCRSAHRYNH